MVPPLELGLRRQRQLVGFAVGEQITTYGDQGFASLRPERGDDVGRPPSPIKAAEDRLVDFESIHESDRIDGDHRRLAVPDRCA